MKWPIPLTTSVVGSYTVPDWFEALGHAVERGEITPEVFRDAKEVAARAAIKDQERAGVDVITDGELFRRSDNRHGPPNAMINYFTAKIPGFSDEIRRRENISPVDPSAFHPAPVVVDELQPANLGLTEELSFLRQHTDRPVKITMTGPHMFAKIAWNEFYASDKDLAFALARIINAEFCRLDEAGCDFIQLDEPLFWLMPQDLSWAIEAVNACFEGVARAKRGLHLCQGNYNVDPTAHVGRRLFPGDYKAIFPQILEAKVDQLVTVSVSVGIEELEVFPMYQAEIEVGVGIVDVQNHRIESAEEVADRIRLALKYVPPERLVLNPDCGLNHLPRHVAFGKLSAMSTAAKMVRQELLSG